MMSTLVMAEPWKGQADLGFISSSGNSETTSVNAQLGLEQETKTWKHAIKLAAIGSTNEDDAGDDNTTSESYSLSLKSDRNLNDRSYIFGVADYSDDRFSGYEFQGTAAVGYGYKVIAQEAMTLLLELGPGYSHSLLSATDTASSQGIEEFIYRLGEAFTWNFSDTSELSQYANFTGGSDLSTLKFGGYVLTKMSDALSLKVGIDLTQRSGDAQDDAEEAAEAAGGDLDDTDMVTYANVSYSF